MEIMNTKLSSKLLKHLVPKNLFTFAHSPGASGRVPVNSPEMGQLTSLEG